MTNYLHQELTEKIIRAYYNVYNKLGYGFLEKIYENALAIEMKNMGLNFSQQVPISVNYDGVEIGNYFADILVENKVILELKAQERFLKEHEAQILNYLKATQIEVGLLLNFGPNPQVSRKIFENHLK